MEWDHPAADGAAVIEKQPQVSQGDERPEEGLAMTSTPATTPVDGQVVKKRRDSKVRFPSEDQLTRVLELGSPWDNGE